MKKIIIIIFILLAIVFSAIIAFLAMPEKNTEATISPNKIMYFYSDSCHYCIQEKPIIEELEKEGVLFEKMNVGEHQEYFKQYDISGTPTFIFKKAENKLAGFQTKEALLKFWNDYK